MTRREQTIRARMATAEVALLDELRKRAGLTRSALIRRLLREELERQEKAQEAHDETC